MPRPAPIPKIAESSPTVRDIADDAGVNVALISRCFDSKEGLFEACLTAAVEDLREITGELALSQIPEAIARQAVGSTADGQSKEILLLLLRSSGDERADRIRAYVLRSFAERLAAVAGWRADGPDVDRLLLSAQVVTAVGIGIVVLRSLPGLEPLASAGTDDLAVPLGELVDVLLSAR